MMIQNWANWLPVAIYFCCALAFNAVASKRGRKLTLNSVDAATARKSSAALCIVALIEMTILLIISREPRSGAAVAYAWVFGALFPAILFADGVLLHFFVPYARSPLVFDQGPTWQAYWVDFHPWGWVLAVLVNVGGVTVHLLLAKDAMALRPGEEPLCSDGIMDSICSFPTVAGAFACLAATLGLMRAKAQQGIWEKRDAAWYPQYRTAHQRTLVSPSNPTFSRFIKMTDEVHLAADVWLPDDDEHPETPLPCIVHFTPYNRNWVTRQCFLAKLLGSYGADSATRLFNTRSPRYLRALVPRGFAFVSVDARGTGASFGSRGVDFSPRERKDFAETARWCRDQKWCEGRFLASGGISYDGMAACAMAAELGADEALAAIFPLFAPQRGYEDICLPGGVPCTGFANSYGAFRQAMEHNTAPNAQQVPMDLRKQALYSAICGGTGDALTGSGPLVWLLRQLTRGQGGGCAPVKVTPNSAGKVQALSKATAEHIAGNWNHAEELRRVRYKDDIIAGVRVCDLDPLLGDAAREARIRDGPTHTLLYAGWFDSGSVASATRFMQAGERCQIVIGPWTHGLRQQCSQHQPTHLAVPKFDMYAHIAEWLTELWAGTQGDVAASWLEPGVRFFIMGAERWAEAKTWPPPGSRDCVLQLRGLAVHPPQKDRNNELYVDFCVDSSASTPVSSRWNLTQHILEEPTDYGDRSLADGLLHFTELTARADAFVVAGTPRVALDLEIHDGDDATIFVYLEDVSPSGHVHYVTEGCFRAGFFGTDSFCKADLRPFSRGVLHIDLQPVAYEFKPRHKVRLSVAGADANNFMAIDGAAQSWTVHLAQSSLTLPELPEP